MQSISEHILLPGGIVRDGTRMRLVTFAALSGCIEMALAIGPETGRHFHDRLSTALALGVERIGDEPMTEELATDLSVGDRQFLARTLGACVTGDEVCLSRQCMRCHESFDLLVLQSELPVKHAGGEYPTATVNLKAGIIRCRVPTGRDQLALSCADTTDPKGWFIDRLIEDAPPGFPGAAALDDEDFARAETAIEDASPEIGTIIETACPACGQIAQVEISPCLGLLGSDSKLLHEIHQLAINYKWSEADILKLPSARRTRYATLIDLEQGVYA